MSYSLVGDFKSTLDNSRAHLGLEARIFTAFPNSGSCKKPPLLPILHFPVISFATSPDSFSCHTPKTLRVLPLKINSTAELPHATPQTC